MYKLIGIILLFVNALIGEVLTYSELYNNCTIDQQRALHEANITLNLDSALFESLEGGMSNAKPYSFVWKDKRYVLRFLSVNASFEKRASEIMAFKMGECLDLAPKNIFCDSQNRLIISAYVESIPQELPLNTIAEMIRKLHDYEGDYPVRLTFNERLKKHYLRVLENGTALPTGFCEVIEKAIENSKPKNFVPCHGDLNVNNILMSDRVYFIDWANATPDDPYIDLAYFSSLANLSEHDEYIFLTAYFRRSPTTLEIKTLHESKALFCLMTAIIWFQFSENGEDRKIPLDDRVNRLNEELNSPHLKSVKDYRNDNKIIHIRTSPTDEIRLFALSNYKAYLDFVK